MKKNTGFLLCFLLVQHFLCAQMSYQAFETQFLDNLWKTYPGWASAEGLHQYDTLLVVPDAPSRERELAFLKTQFELSGKVNAATLSEKTDLKLIKNFIASSFWQHQKLKEHEWNPAQYNVCGSFSNMLFEDYASFDKRMQDIFRRLRNVPAYYEAAKKNLKHPTQEHTQLAKDQNRNAIGIFEKDIPAAIAKSSLPGVIKRVFYERNDSAKAAVLNYVKFLDSLKLDNARSFRLGKDLYKSKFNHAIQDDYEKIEVKALERKLFLHQQMSRLADKLWVKYFGNAPKPADTLLKIRKMIDTISASHCEADSFQATIEKQIPDIIAFVKKKNLITLDDSKPLVVRREPDYMAGVAGASISSPGPFEPQRNTYYNVGSLHGWTDAEKESYLREYNDYILQILNIHEAIPGHYVQLIYSNRSPSIIKSILGNNAMVEGWAVYSEYMMIENGYGNNEKEMWLMYYKWNLRSVCNTLLDINVHVNNWSKEQAMDLLVNQAFQQQKEAEGKWKRATLSSVQLCSYFSGFSKILELRNTVCPDCTKNVDLLRAFHERFLSFGSIPVREIEKLMR